LNLYSHFSGSDIDNKALVVPQDNSTVADRMGPFQHFALSIQSSLYQASGVDLPVGVSLLGVVVERAFWSGIIPSGERAAGQLCSLDRKHSIYPRKLDELSLLLF
jgi:hypothetical protein